MIIQVENPALEVHDMTVSYDRRPVLWGVDFSIPKGHLTCVLGPNGSGKTTLIKAIMDLVPKNSGYAKIFDQDIDDVRDKVSYIPQRGSVDWDFPASVMDVVLMGRYKKNNIFNRISRTDRINAEIALEKVGMKAFAKRQISQLSGGQQQRVFIARALAQEAEFYLMDEPFAGVDAATENAILNLLKEMKDEGKTILLIHHDIQTAYDYFDWFVFLNTRLIASGPKETVFSEKTLSDTYGGKLSLLTTVGELLKEKKLPVRE
ncbi:MAG: metal ABC transporter ATP-binding protein [Chitinophagales bacterium]|nr:metal ABC transporter ATP-binding protein [Chitinophagales bacterium]